MACDDSDDVMPPLVTIAQPRDSREGAANDAENTENIDSGH